SSGLTLRSPSTGLITSEISFCEPLHPNMCSIIESAAGPQLFGVCFSYGGEGSKACAGRGGNVAVAGMGVSTMALVGVMGTAVFTGLGVFVGLRIAVGTLPTGW